MKKRYCNICGKYGKPEKPKILCHLEKTLVFSITGSKCKNEGKKLFKEQELIEILQIIGLTESM